MKIKFIYTFLVHALFASTSLFALPQPEILDSRFIFDGFIKVRNDRLRYSDGHEQNYYFLVTRSSAVVVLAITDEGLLVLNKEYRHPAESMLLCCPGGCIDPGEGPLEAAQRELLEETGYNADKYILMGCCFPYPGLSQQKIYHVLATGAKKQSDPMREHGEIQETVLMSRGELKKSIAEGQAIDGIMGTALFYYSLTNAFE